MVAQTPANRPNPTRCIVIINWHADRYGNSAAMVSRKMVGGLFLSLKRV